MSRKTHAQHEVNFEGIECKESLSEGGGSMSEAVVEEDYGDEAASLTANNIDSGFDHSSSNISSSSADDLLASVADLLHSKTTFTLDESASLQEEMDRLKLMHSDFLQGSSTCTFPRVSILPSPCNEDRANLTSVTEPPEIPRVVETESVSCSPAQRPQPDDIATRNLTMYREQKRKLANILRKSLPKPVDFVLLPSDIKSNRIVSTQAAEQGAKSRVDAIFLNDYESCMSPPPPPAPALNQHNSKGEQILERDGVGRYPSPASVLLDLRLSLEDASQEPKVPHENCPRMPERKPSFEED